MCGMGGEVSSLFAVRVDLITPDHKANMPENVNNESILNTPPVEKSSTFDLTLSDVVRYPII